MATQPTLEHPQATLTEFEGEIAVQESVVASAERALSDAQHTLASMQKLAERFRDRYAAEGYELKPLSWKEAEEPDGEAARIDHLQ